jgi:hypothetical protein
MDDHKLAVDQARREAQVEQVKAEVEGDVAGEIAARAARRDAEAAGQIREAADRLRDDAIDEVVQGERELQRGRAAARVSQVIDYVFYVIYALLGLRFVLGMIAASSAAGFVSFIRSVTAPLYAPFRGMVQSPATPEGNVFEWPLLIAILVYALVHLGINGLLRMVAQRKTAI